MANELQNVSYFSNNDLMMKLKKERESACQYQERKHADWNENYELYRNKVRTNRLTQRQAVNIPLMKETIKTLMSQVDDPPSVDWQDLGGDADKELLFQELWDDMARTDNLELTDTLDKKNVLLHGIGTKMLNISERGVTIHAEDVFDVKFDPLMTVGKIETARFIVRQNIFRSVQEILADKKYSKTGKNKLKVYIDSPAGIQQGQENKEAFEDKMKRMRAMDPEHSDFTFFAGGDRLIAITEHFTNVWNNKTKKFERRIITYADNQIELRNELLIEAIGVDFWPFTVWTEDPETNDLYPDAVADLVRTPNKVLNVWFSQLVENRTLQNFQMHWYLPMEGYTPQTYVPGPGMMLPAPPGENINNVIKPVEIKALDDTFQAIQILTQIVERGTGATAIDKGTAEKGKQTLGEIEILVGKSAERTLAMSKFYRASWRETAEKWAAMMHANAPKVAKLYKTGLSGKMYMKNVFASDWKSREGYRAHVASSSEQEQEAMQTIQKFMFLLQQFPNNMELRKIAQKRMLESVDLSPEELAAIKQAESATPALGTPQIGQQGVPSQFPELAQ